MTSQIAYLSQSYVYIVYFYNDSIYNIIVLIIKSYAHTVFPIMVHFSTAVRHIHCWTTSFPVPSSLLMVNHMYTVMLSGLYWCIYTCFSWVYFSTILFTYKCGFFQVFMLEYWCYKSMNTYYLLRNKRMYCI
jgi:hypothetical protein